MKLDAHQHFWHVAQAADYPWMSPDEPVLYRDYQPDALKPILARHDIEGTILVQASPTLAETEVLLRLAETTPFVKGVVGWCEFDAVAAPAAIATLARSPWLVGLRPMVQDIADDGWLLREQLQPAFEAMMEHELVFDALVLPRHLTPLAELTRRHPALRVVVDHGAKPALRSGMLDQWRRDIAAVARFESTACKLSGLVTECGADRSIERLRPVVDHLLDCFGTERLMWGSDWPVVNLAGGYDEWMTSAEALLAHLGGTARDAIFGDNARRIYLEGAPR